MKLRPMWSRFTRIQKAIGLGAGLLLLYASVGFFLLPVVIEGQLKKQASARLGRELDVDEVRLNPFALSLSLRGVALSDLDGSAIVEFEELYVNFQSSSLFRRAFTFDAIRLVAPQVRLVVDSEGESNLATLVVDAKERSGPAAEPTDTETELPRLLVGQLEIVDGGIAVLDQSMKTPWQVAFLPIQISLSNFSTLPDREGPYSFVASTDQGERFSWEGTLSLNPIHSEGRFDLSGVQVRSVGEYLQEELHFEVDKGVLDLGASYVFDIDGEIALSDGFLTLRDLELSEVGSENPYERLKLIEVRDVFVNVVDQQVRVGSIRIQEGETTVVRKPDGKIDLSHYLVAEKVVETVEESVAEQQAAEEPEEPVEEPAWSLALDSLKVEHFAVHFMDRSLPTPAEFQIVLSSLSLRDFSTEAGAKFPLGVDLIVAGGGKLSLDGALRLNPIAADLELGLSALNLTDFQPYVDSLAAVELTQGRVEAKGIFHLSINPEGGARLQYEGGAGVRDIEVVDQKGNDRFLALSALYFEGIYASNEDGLVVEKIRLEHPYLRLIVRPDGKSNLSNIVASAERKRRKADLSTGKEVDEAPKAKNDPLPVRVSLIEIKGGSINYLDESLDPHIATGIQEFGGSVVGLSSEKGKHATLDLRGKLDEYGPFGVSGELAPLSEPLFADFDVKLEQVDLPTYTAYSEKYVGKVLNKGKLTLDSSYQVADLEVKGKNEIFIDQLEFGEAVESPDATDLPVSLAVATLKNGRGEVKLSIPVKGRMDDPNFKVGGLLVKTFNKVIWKAATSPFVILAGIAGAAGGAEELSHVNFDSGSAALSEAEARQLDVLVKALNERPTLQLEVSGGASMDGDRQGIQRAKLELALRGASAAEKNDPAKADLVALSEAERLKALEKAYRATFEEKSSTLRKRLRAGQGGVAPKTKDAKAAEDQLLRAGMEKRLLQAQEVSEQDLRNLASARAGAIRVRLVEHGGIAAERVFVVEPDLKVSPQGQQVPSQLGVGAG